MTIEMGRGGSIGWEHIIGILLLAGSVSLAAFRLMPWGALASLTSRRRDRSIEFAAARIQPVEEFNRLIFEVHDRLSGVLGAWGRDAPYDQRMRERAKEVFETHLYELRMKGLAAREASRRIDGELDQRVRAMEAASVNLMSRLDSVLINIPVDSFIERNEEVLSFHQSVSDRISELLKWR